MGPPFNPGGGVGGSLVRGPTLLRQRFSQNKFHKTSGAWGEGIGGGGRSDPPLWVGGRGWSAGAPNLFPERIPPCHPPPAGREGER